MVQGELEEGGYNKTHELVLKLSNPVHKPYRKLDQGVWEHTVICGNRSHFFARVP